ncbi:hypothetical protein B484DRAFT_390467, partial [Ochromonadaceae sp. CCMP2298]
SRRNVHLRHALSQCNALLLFRMASQGSISALSTSMHDIYAYHGLTAATVAQLCPEAAQYSLHLPLQHGKDTCLRILRFVEAECEVLPSKERCPYLVVAELLEQDFACSSEKLYAQGQGGQVGLGGGPAVALTAGQVAYGGRPPLPPPPLPSSPFSATLSRPLEQEQQGNWGTQIYTSSSGLAEGGGMGAGGVRRSLLELEEASELYAGASAAVDAVLGPSSNPHGQEQGQGQQGR